MLEGELVVGGTKVVKGGSHCVNTTCPMSSWRSGRKGEGVRWRVSMRGYMCIGRDFASCLNLAKSLLTLASLFASKMALHKFFL